LNRAFLSTWTNFPNNGIPESIIYKYFYDGSSHLIKLVSINSWDKKDSTISEKYYSSDNKLIKEKTTSSSSNYWQGFTHYHYDQEKLLKRLSYDLTETEIESIDSIVYTDTSKIIFELFSENILGKKTIVSIKNNKPKNQTEYYKESFSNDMYLRSEIKYFYNTQDSLVKKEEFLFAHTEFCGFGSKDKKLTYTFAYTDR